MLRICVLVFACKPFQRLVDAEKEGARASFASGSRARRLHVRVAHVHLNLAVPRMVEAVDEFFLEELCYASESIGAATNLERAHVQLQQEALAGETRLEDATYFADQ